jgi:hypothetical protein
MSTIPFSALETADLYVDAIYEGGPGNSFQDEPLSKLLGVDNQGGFRVLGQKKGKVALRLLVLATSMADADWPDSLDPETGLFTYYGDNKKPGRELHETGRRGNEILREIFLDAYASNSPRANVPPILAFSATGQRRAYRFLGLAVPGAPGIDPTESLVAIWKVSAGVRFQNYKAHFTILNVPRVERRWLNDIRAGSNSLEHAPASWLKWKAAGQFSPLIADRSIEYRSKEEQLPHSEADHEILRAVYEKFKHNPIAFERCAAELMRMLLPRVSQYELTRPSRDGGRDAIGHYLIGEGVSSVKVDFAMEAKCWGIDHGVGVKETSRLISRLKHRQFGVFVTTSYINETAYREIKDDGHPIIIVSGGDIVKILRSKLRTSVDDVSQWLGGLIDYHATLEKIVDEAT